MTATLIRVVNSQTLVRSILLDKIDRSQANFETGISYAQLAKQKLYVPYSNPLDPTVAGYLDLVPTDEVLLQVNQPKGVIAQLSNAGRVSFYAHAGSLTATPAIASCAHSSVAHNGTNGAFAAAIAGVANFTDSTANAFSGADVGKFLNVTAGGVATSRGSFEVTANVTTSVDTVANPAAVLDAGALTWNLIAGTTLVGTTFQSLTPDHTYIIVTNLSGSIQTLTDTAIIAAGGSVGATSIIIPPGIVSGGPIIAGWSVQVKANSKLSNAFTIT